MITLIEKKLNDLYLNYKNHFPYINNKFELPKLIKIIIHRNISKDLSNKTLIDTILNKHKIDFKLITNQSPIIKVGGKNFTNLKSSSTNINLKVTLRRKKMFIFLDEFINFVMPKLDDAETKYSIKNLDFTYNYNFNIKTNKFFPGYYNTFNIFEFTNNYNISICIQAKFKKESIYLLKLLNIIN